ncbi:hypothetical protein HYS47_04110 [Candidatus Woesearchaeota archaeon]|nr:hypothetical protein [Candidatus Woesearchaeota archaeon]
MKLTRFDGIAHDLVGYLDFQIWHGYFKDTPKEMMFDALRNRTGLGKTCSAFVQERVPASFDFNRVKKIQVRIKRTMTLCRISVQITVDKEIFSYPKIPTKHEIH